MSKHTPGPWTAVRNEVDARGLYWVCVETADGKMPVIYPTQDGDLCIKPSDARLIAAAPELLDALKIAEKQLEAGYEVTGGSHGNGIGLTAMKIVRAAIAKAEGTEK